MTELHGVVAGQQFGQIPREGQSCHLCSMAVVVVDSPSGLDGVQIGGSEGGLDQRMAAIDPRVQEADMRHFVGAGRISDSSRQLFEPFGLFLR